MSSLYVALRSWKKSTPAFARQSLGVESWSSLRALSSNLGLNCFQRGCFLRSLGDIVWNKKGILTSGKNLHFKRWKWQFYECEISSFNLLEHVIALPLVCIIEESHESGWNWVSGWRVPRRINLIESERIPLYKMGADWNPVRLIISSQLTKCRLGDCTSDCQVLYF